MTSPSLQLKGGEIVSVRGMGKFQFTGTENETKKGRIFVSARKITADKRFSERNRR